MGFSANIERLRLGAGPAAGLLSMATVYSTIERKEKRQSLPPRSARCTIRPLWRQKMAGSGAHRNYASLFATLCATGSVQAADFLERSTHRGRLRGGRRERSAGSRPLGA